MQQIAILLFYPHKIWAQIIKYFQISQFRQIKLIDKIKIIRRRGVFFLSNIWGKSPNNKLRFQGVMLVNTNLWKINKFNRSWLRFLILHRHLSSNLIPTRWVMISNNLKNTRKKKRSLSQEIFLTQVKNQLVILIN